jgi:hypothetical protein
MGEPTRLDEELNSFTGLWSGGYYEGDPLDPLGRSSYGELGFMSVLHATWLRCIKPYVGCETIALEIGPGRGAWTKTLLPCREIWALDALSAEHNGFYEYLGAPDNVTYVQVTDFSCRDLPLDHFTYMFSFGALCHVSFEGMCAYAQNLFPRLKSGADCFWMFADYDKYNRAVASLDVLSCFERAVSVPSTLRGWRHRVANLLVRNAIARQRPNCLVWDGDSTPAPGRWYHAEGGRVYEMLERTGYVVLDEDVGTSLRDPIVHFMKP